MKQLALFLMGIVYCVNSSAQTTRVSHILPDYAFKEEYYVLKTDKKTREGKYKLLTNPANTLLCDGAYKNNLKEGLWQYYRNNGAIADSGRYNQDKKVGIWSAYNYKGELLVQYDFSAGKLLFIKPRSRADNEYSVINGRDTVKANLERAPIYLDGDSRTTFMMVNTIRYPRGARESGTSGKVVVAFTINEDGKIANYRIKKSLRSDCDEEAMRVVKRINGDWLPGMLKGKPVAIEYSMPVSFALAN